MGPRLWRPCVLKSQFSPRGFNFPLVRNSAPLRLRAPSLPLGISARLPKWRRPRSSFPLGSLSGARRIPLSEAMRETRSGTRNAGCGVGSGIRSLPPLRTALPAAANVGFLLRVSLRTLYKYEVTAVLLERPGTPLRRSEVTTSTHELQAGGLLLAHTQPHLLCKRSDKTHAE